MILSEFQLAQMRLVVARSFVQDITIYRKGYLNPLTGEFMEGTVPDGYGGDASTFLPYLTTKGRLTPLRGKTYEKPQAAEVQSVKQYRALLPFGTDVKAEDRLRIDEEWFEIVSTNIGRAEAKSVEAILERVE